MIDHDFTTVVKVVKSRSNHDPLYPFPPNLFLL